MRPDDRRILVGLEEDGTAEAVLAVAQQLAGALGARLEVVHVGPDLPPALAELADAAGVDVDVEQGDPVAVLRRRLAAPRSLMAVVGCHGADCGASTGHVPLALVQEATVPVAVVPMSARVGRDPLHEVLLPLDGSREVAAAVDPTVAALGGSGLRVTVVHVLAAEHVPMFLDQPHHAMDAWGREFLARQAASDVELVLRTGHPGEQLVEIVTAADPDLVVLGWSQDLSPGRAQTIRELLAASPTPLLLVPTGAADGAAEVSPSAGRPPSDVSSTTRQPVNG